MQGWSQLGTQYLELVRRLNWVSVFDILLVSAAIYYALTWVKNTRAWQIILGLIVILFLAQLSAWLHLYALNWLLSVLLVPGVVVLVVLFQPELRLAIDQLGRGELVRGGWLSSPRRQLTQVVNEVGKAVEELAAKRTGALLVLEREMKLEDVKDTGRRVGGEVSADLLLTIFNTGSPLHDGAVVISNDKIAAAGCILPLTDNPNLPHSMGTRHRAALGLTETADALVVVVSEETGNISLVRDGEMEVALHSQALKERLLSLMTPNNYPPSLRPLRRSGGSAS